MKYLCIILIVFCSCNNSATVVKNEDVQATKDTTELEKHADWLLGEWHQLTPEGHAVEKWEKQNDTCYIGLAYFLVGKDTTSTESIRLVQRGEDLFYIPTVKDQNAGKPVEFKLTGTEHYQLLFENPTHDFPQKISYEQVTKTYMIARISGTINGKLKSQEFPMIRK